MAHRPVLVVAPGRSGTSTIARLLHRTFKIHMGDRFHPADSRNKQGYYEDLDFRKIDESFANPKSPHQLLSAEYWELLTKLLLQEKAGENRPWGYKEPRLSFFLGYHVDILRGLDLEPLLLRPRRPIHKVAASVHLHMGWDSIWEAFGAVAMRDYVIDATIATQGVTCYEFYFPPDGSKVSDLTVVEWIKECLDTEDMEYDKENVEKYLEKQREDIRAVDSEQSPGLDADGQHRVSHVT